MMTEGQKRRLQSELQRLDVAVTSAMREGIRTKGMRECDVAAAIGMNAGTFSLSINRHRAFTMDEVFRVCEVVGLEPFEVMFGSHALGSNGEVA